ncbi:MAG: lysylphosphatidylglycerol synthase transmembrane domain-containing protein [bacterium]
MIKTRTIRMSLILLSFAFGVAIFIWLINREGFAEISQHVARFGFLPFLGFLALSIFNFIFYSWRWQIITNRHLPKSQHISLIRMYMNRMSGYAASYLTPAAQVGGEPVRIAMLASEGVPLKQATSSVVLDVAFELAAYIAFILAGVALAMFGGLAVGSVTIVLVGLAVALAIIISFFVIIARGRLFFTPLLRFFRIDRIGKLKRFENSLKKTEGMMSEFLSGKPWLLVGISLLSLFVIAFRIVEVFYIAHFLGVSFGFAEAFLVATLPGVALLLPVPAGLGIYEGGFAAVFTVLSIPLSAVAFALIIRARDLIFILVGLTQMLDRGRAFIEKRLLRVK